MNIYWEIIIATAVLAFLFRRYRKAFVVSTAILHGFIAAFRYNHMHGDLMKYHSEYEDLANYSLFSNRILRSGKNTLFYMLNKIVGDYTNHNFQALIIIIAVISAIALGVLIYRYSEKPFISFLLWNCFGFYIFTFYSIKQALAMAIIMLAAACVVEEKRRLFYILVAIAGFVHFPAFIFLPAYELSRLKRARSIITVYLTIFIIIFIFRNSIVQAMTDVYYEEETVFEETTVVIGGKTMMLIAIFIMGLLMCSMNDKVSRVSVLLVGVAMIIQMFSIYDNVFTRLADYYFQFVILLIPSMLRQRCHGLPYPRMFFNEKSQRILTYMIVALAIVYYQRTTLGAYSGGVDDLVHNFAFMWQK